MLMPKDLIAHFQPGPIRSERPRVGFEYEVPLFHRADRSPVGYEGDRGLGAMMRFLADRHDGQLLPGEPIKKVTFVGGANVSLEPGGQLEFSSAPVDSFAGLLSQLGDFSRWIADLTGAFDVVPFFGGLNPVHTVEQIGLVIPTRRYQIMDRYFPRVGTMGRRMMRQSASVQVSFDYPDVQAGEELLRAALFITPWVAGMFANAPYVDGRATGYRSYRTMVWRHTDPARCGSIPGFERDDFSFSDYLQFVTRAPMFFVETDEGLVDAEGMTFDQFNAGGFRGRQARRDDFALHNSTIFTDARLRQTVELRPIDCQEPTLLPSALALVCGLLMTSGARRQLIDRLRACGGDRAEQVALQLAQHGLKEQGGAVDVQGTVLDLIDIAGEGLPSSLPDGADACSWLDPLRGLARSRSTPADLVIERYGDDPDRWLSAEPATLV